MDFTKNRDISAFFQNRSAWFSVFLAINLITLPNFIASFTPTFSWPVFRLWYLGFAVILFPCVLGMRVRPMLWMISPIVLLVPACLICLCSLYSLPSTFMLLALIETNQTELAVFQTYILYGVAGMLLMAALYAWIVHKRVPADLKLGPVGRTLVLVALLFTPVTDLLTKGPAACMARIEDSYMNAFPVSTACCAYEAMDIRSRAQDRRDLAENLPITQEEGFQKDPQRQVHMLVIGESATKSCFSLYGYDRPTTPLLEKTPDLMPFRDVSCAATFTLLAVPAMLTAAPPGQVIEATKQASVLSAYKKAGFRVYWLSSQKKHGTFDTLTSIFSAEADEAVFLGGKFDATGQGAYADAYDASLLPLVRDILKRKEPKVLFVLHTIGSHGPYPARYPPEMARFPAERGAVRDAQLRLLSGLPVEPEALALVQNAYDNTICATDTLLDSLIKEVSQTQASSWLCYLSDHGENTSKSMLNKFMHGVVSPQVVEIPMLMWLSPQYKQAHADRAGALQAHLSSSFSAACTFHTLLDMGGISCPDFKKEWSAASAQFTPGARVVCGPRGANVDYDKQFPDRRKLNAAGAVSQHQAEQAQPLMAGRQQP